MSLIEFLVSLLAPHTCVSCGREGSLLCADCSGGLRVAISRCFSCHKITDRGKTCDSCRRQTALKRVQALVIYERSAKDLVWRLKFERAKFGATEIAHRLAPLIMDEYADGYRRTDELTLVSVPTATKRVRRRGYDQSSLITKQLAKETGLPRCTLLSRVGQQRQVGGSRERRREQVKNAFRVRQPGKIQGAHVILIDDVVTTGATLEAAAATLKAAGAKKVEAVVFAQS